MPDDGDGLVHRRQCRGLHDLTAVSLGRLGGGDDSFVEPRSQLADRGMGVERGGGHGHAELPLQGIFEPDHHQ